MIRSSDQVMRRDIPKIAPKTILIISTKLIFLFSTSRTPIYRVNFLILAYQKHQSTPLKKNSNIWEKM